MCTVVASSSKSESSTISHSNPYSSERRRMREPYVLAATSSSSWSSFSARTKSLADSGLKQTAAAPPGLRPSSVSMVIRAVVSAQSLSLRASGSFLRPSRTSRRPNG